MGCGMASKCQYTASGSKVHPQEPYLTFVRLVLPWSQEVRVGANSETTVLQLLKSAAFQANLSADNLHSLRLRCSQGSRRVSPTVSSGELIPQVNPAASGEFIFDVVVDEVPR